MKKLPSYILLFCLIAPFSGTYLWMNHLKESVRKEVKLQIISGIDKEELVLLKFSDIETNSKLKWVHSKEFEFQGAMFDIVEVENSNDSVYYWCWSDNKETKLNQQLDKLTELAFGSNKDAKKKSQELKDFFQTLYCVEPPSYEFFRRVEYNQFDFYFLGKTERFQTPNSPPPEIS